MKRDDECPSTSATDMPSNANLGVSRRKFLTRTGLLSLAGAGVVLPSIGAMVTTDDVEDAEASVVLNVKDSPYYAKGDGRTDDTNAINRCIAGATEGSRIYFPPGTYVVSPDASGYMIFVNKRNLELFGAGHKMSKLTVKPDAGDYIAMMTNHTTGASFDASGLYVHDLEINQNNTFNRVADRSVLMGSMYRIPMIWSTKVHNGRVERCHFSDSESVANILITDGNGWSVSGNLFDGVGAGPYHDHSTLHIRGDGTHVIDNVFKGAGPSAWTAIELHGSKTLVSGNKVHSYGRLGIVCGVRVVGFDNTWSKNQGFGLACGIQIWAFDDMIAEELVGPSVRNLTIVENDIEVNYGLWPDTSTSRSGVEVYLSSTGVVHSAHIINNHIRFVNIKRTSGKTIDWRSCGVSWCRGGDIVTEGDADEDIEISDNVIEEPIANGIQINPYRSLRGLRIRKNTIVDPGSGVTNTIFRRGIVAFFPASRTYLLQDAELSDNSLIDTRANHIMSAGIDLSGVDRVANGVLARNTVRCADGAAVPALLQNALAPWRVL